MNPNLSDRLRLVENFFGTHLRSLFGVWRLAFGVWRLAFGVWRLAFGVYFGVISEKSIQLIYLLPTLDFYRRLYSI
jgi:hypothetical protein